MKLASRRIALLLLISFLTLFSLGSYAKVRNYNFLFQVVNKTKATITYNTDIDNIPNLVPKFSLTAIKPGDTLVISGTFSVSGPLTSQVLEVEFYEKSKPLFSFQVKPSYSYDSNINGVDYYQADYYVWPKDREDYYYPLRSEDQNAHIVTIYERLSPIEE